MLAVLASLVLLFLVGSAVLGILGLFVFSKNLPSPDKLQDRDTALSTQILDRNGKTLYGIHGDENRVLVKLEDVPPILIQATLATEDGDFYQHKGFDVFGIFRAFYQGFFRGNTQGGSTITQQLIKNTLLTSERTYIRKIKEIVISVQLEKKFKKNEILQMYLNEVPYGGTARGVEAASRSFFGKSVKDITPSEAVFLAGMPQSPSAYLADPEKAENRRHYVIKLMEENGWVDETGQHHTITHEEAEKMRNERPTVSTVSTEIEAPHFVWYVRDLLEQRYGKELVEQGGLKVTTTLDLELQQKMQGIVADEVAKAESLLVGNGALVAINPQTGEILSMVGSRDYFDEPHDGNVNVTTRLRQPGSSIKPFTYVAGFKQGYTASYMLMDVPTTFPGGANLPEYKPGNYDGKYRGPIQVRYALGSSINVPAVKMLQLVGVDKMLKTAYDMGLTTLESTVENRNRFGLSVTLGGGEVRLLELTSAYGVFASSGVRHDPVGILKVEDKTGKVMEEWKPTDGNKVLSPEEAYLMSNILSDDSARALVFSRGSLLAIPGHEVAVKTGTTDDKRDNWTVGYTPDIVIGVWVGNNDNSPMSPSLSSGLTGAAPIWNRAIKTFLEGKPRNSFNRPPGIVGAEVDSLSGKLPGDNTEEKRPEIFIKGTVPAEVDDVHVQLEICEEDDNLANDDCKDDGKSDEKLFIVIKEPREDWQKNTDEWIEKEKKDDEMWNPPDEETDYKSDKDSGYLPSNILGGIAPPSVKITSPFDGATVSDSFEMTVVPTSAYRILRVQYFVDDQMVTSKTSVPYTATINLPSVSTGSVKLTAKAIDSAGELGETSITVNH